MSSRLGTAAVFAAYVLALAITALLPWLTGREPAYAVLRAREREREATPELLEAIRTEFNLPTTPWESLTTWFRGVIRGDFGQSWVNPATGAMDRATSGLGITLSLTAAATAFSVVVAFAIVLPRLVAAAKGHTRGRAAAQGIAVLSSLPDFVVAVLLLWLFALQLNVLPVGGWSSPAHMVLPTLSLGLVAGGLYGRVLLIAADAAVREAWVEAWRVNGVPTAVIVRHLAWRAFVPTSSMLTLFFAGTLTATAAIEVTFNIPGFGRTVVDAALNADIPVIQAAVFIVLVIGGLSGAASQLLRTRVLKRLVGETAGASAVSATAGQVQTGRWHRVSIFAAVAPLAFIALGIFRDAGINIDHRFARYSLAHPLGADQLGRDIWARLADGLVYSVGVAIAVTAVSAVTGLIAGHLGSWLLRIGDVLNAVPAILLGLILAAVFGPAMITAAIAVAMVAWIPLASHCAAVVQEAQSSGHYRFAETMGASKWHLLRYHVLPQTVPAVLRHAVGRIAHNAISLAALGYLGVGAAVGSPDWGVILDESTQYLERAPWMALGPTVGLVSLGVVAALLTDKRTGH